MDLEIDSEGNIITTDGAVTLRSVILADLARDAYLRGYGPIPSVNQLRALNLPDDWDGGDAAPPWRRQCR